MLEEEVPWPHAPPHQLSEAGTFFITAGTYLKAHHFREPTRLAVLQRGLLRLTYDFGWHLEAWAIFSNHYHFIAQAPSGDLTGESLRSMLAVLHEKTAKWINRLESSPGRKVWHNFWDTRLTYQTSYLARLNYVHQNPVKHGLVPVANQYPWCSARWFERTATPARVKVVYRFKTGKVRVPDEFEVAPGV